MCCKMNFLNFTARIETKQATWSDAQVRCSDTMEFNIRYARALSLLAYRGVFCPVCLEGKI
jgi:hypothetical protein